MEPNTEQLVKQEEFQKKFQEKLDIITLDIIDIVKILYHY